MCSSDLTVTQIPRCTVRVQNSALRVRIHHPLFISLPLDPPLQLSIVSSTSKRPIQSPKCGTQSVAGLSYRGRNVSIYEQVAGDPEESVPNTPSPSRQHVRVIEYVPGAGRSHGETNGSTGTTLE